MTTNKARTGRGTRRIGNGIPSNVGDGTSPAFKLTKLKEMERFIDLCRDFANGTQCLDTDAYFPKQERESTQAYDSRRANSFINNLYKPILNGLVKMVTQKNPNLTEAMTNLGILDITNVDNNGTHLYTFIEEVLEEALVDGASYIAVQTFTEGETQGMYLKKYGYRQLNSFYQENGKTRQYVFEEDIEVAKGDNKFSLDIETRYVVYRAFGGATWYAGETNNEITQQDVWTNTLDEPAVVRVTAGLERTPEEIYAFLYDIAAMNRSLLGFESFHAKLLNVVANPIPMLFGEIATPDVSVGVSDAICFSDKQTGGVEYLEIRGQSVALLTEKIQTTIDNINRAGFSLMTRVESRTKIEAAETSNKGQGFAVALSCDLENAFNTIFKFMAEIANREIPQQEGPGNILIDFNKQFSNNVFTQALFDSFLTATQNNLITKETFWEILRGWDLLPYNFDPSDENTALTAQEEQQLRAFMGRQGSNNEDIDSDNDEISPDNDSE